MIAAIEGSDLAVILGAAGVIWAPLIIGLITINSKTTAINTAVNNRPKDEPKLYDRVANVEAAAALAAQAAQEVKDRLDVKDTLDANRHEVEVAAIANVGRTVSELVQLEKDHHSQNSARLDVIERRARPEGTS